MKLRMIAKATRAALLPALALTALSAPALADDTPYAMVVLDATPQARLIRSGEYWKIMEAVARLEGGTAKSFDALNNLCVAYTMVKSFDKAMTACDAALASPAVAVAEDRTPFAVFTKAGMDVDDRKALVLTNRAVLKAVSGDLAGAREDLALAADLSDAIPATDANMVRLAGLTAGSTTVAQAVR